MAEDKKQPDAKIKKENVEEPAEDAVEEPVLEEAAEESDEVEAPDAELNKVDEKRFKAKVRERAKRELTREEKLEEWVPRTKLGTLVKSGQIRTMHDALNSGLPLREVEIVDLLLPELDDEVLDVNMVQRMTDSGRRVRFAITTVVGNSDGYVGIGVAKGKEVGPAIRKAIDNAKVNIVELKRGCGSWECGCREPHSFPFQVKGKCSSVEIILKPAPKGVSLAVSDIPRKILKLAGIKDCWAVTNGQTRTTINYSKAIFDALQQLNRTKISKAQREEFNIVEGQIGGMKQ